MPEWNKLSVHFREYSVLEFMEMPQHDIKEEFLKTPNFFKESQKFAKELKETSVSYHISPIKAHYDGASPPLTANCSTTAVIASSSQIFFFWYVNGGIYRAFISSHSMNEHPQTISHYWHLILFAQQDLDPFQWRTGEQEAGWVTAGRRGWVSRPLIGAVWQSTNQVGSGHV